MVGSCMAKLFGSIIEQDICAWAENNGKRAIGQARFRPKHSTVDHLVTLRILMEETRLKGKTLYCCFVDFKKAFDTVPRKGLWNRMESIGVPLHLRAAVARLYEEVKCKLKTQTGFSQEFMSTMGVKQGCPFSPTLFGLCIDQLEDFVGHVLEEEKDKPSIGAFTLLLLMYADDVVLFGYSIHALQKLLHSVHAFCDATGLSVNVAKTKVMMVRTHKTADQPILMYNGQSLEVVDSFKYLGINVRSNHAWGHCAQSTIEASKAKYYEFENMCKQSVTKRWEIKAMVFETCVVQTLLYGVEVWGASISASIWNDIEKLQKKFLCRYMGVKATTPYSVMLLETGKRPLEMLALQRVHKYIMKVKLMPKSRIPHIAWDIGCKPRKNYKSKFLTSSFVQDIRKWFAKWNVEAYVDMPILEGTKDEHALNFDIMLLEYFHTKWQNAIHQSKFEYYCKHVNTRYWENYKVCKPDAQAHIKTSISHRARQAITLMRTRSHMLKIETGGWLKIDANKRMCNQCDMNALEHETHVALECPAYAHIRDDFPQLIQGCTTFEELLSYTHPSPVALGIYLARVLEHHAMLTRKTITPT
ncbi:hypothetical protein L7F22_033295 [Adiantum nelumboides]|nr:hypothetical protein [Adiantum nelumboides]